MVGLQAIDIECGDIHIGPPVYDPAGQYATQTATRENADGIESGRDEITRQFGRFAHNRLQVGRKAFRSAEEFPHPDFERAGHASHRLFQIRRHAVPVRRQVTEGKVLRYALQLPRRAFGLEQADHQAGSFLAVVAVGGWIFEYRHPWRQILDRFGDQVVVLGRLIRNRHAVCTAQLARPHAGAVHDKVGLDISVHGPYRTDTPALLPDT